MQEVEGIGGLFFRASDPKKLAQWYLKNLGISLFPGDANTPPWIQEPGPTIFSPFSSDTEYFRSDRQYMVNFRVADLDAMIAQLKAAEIEVSHQESTEGVGHFARIHDPEGNPIELWQPG